MGESRTFNFINSIKGGCGKTTFSIFLMKYLNTLDMKAVDKEEKSLLLDMDLQGSAMQCLFEGMPKIMNQDEHGKPDEHGNLQGIEKLIVTDIKMEKHKYLNEAVRVGGEVGDYVVRNQITEEIALDVIFADSRYNEKEKFRVSSKTGYSPTTQYNVFKGGLHRFLRKLKDADYKHFVFDMPPNSDGFSGAALECVMNEAYGIRKENDRVNLFFLTGYDWGQVYETFKEVEALLLNKENFYYDNLFIVFNDNVVHNELGISNLFKTYVDSFCKVVELSPDQQQHKRICFFSMGAHEAYSSYCMEGKGLRNLYDTILKPNNRNLDDYIPQAPVVECRNLDRESVPMSEEKFLKNKMISE